MNREQQVRPSRAAWGQDRLSRRQFIVGATAVAAVGGGTAVAVSGLKPEPEPARTPICMAMHVHASASEGIASMQSQLVQAADSGVDVLWWTEHDHRMEAHAAARRIDFSGRQQAVSDG